MNNMSDKKIVSEAEWNQARQDLLDREKALNKWRDEIAVERRSLPWHQVKEDYLFSGPEGQLRLSELFGSKSQLIVYHFMYGPDWQEGCKSCSFWADQYDGINRHIGARDVSLAVVSRAPWQDFQAFKQRMKWGFTWLSSAGNTFNTDYHISFPDQKTGYYNYTETRVREELPGLSVFFKDDKGDIFHTYSTYARGLDPLNATYQMLDLVPKGRDEADLAYGMAWLKHHDDY
jgi:predicted dithiol-disulfide oxidoreductase (DUF899 family)